MSTRHASRSGGPSPSPTPEEAWGRPSAPSATHRAPHLTSEDGRSRDLLIETRKLLNILNDENSELKATHDDLKGQLAKKQNEKERLESDMKKINFNLMEDLRKKSAAVKELERQLALVSSDATKESRRSTDSMSRVATLEAENTLLREQVRSANGRSDSLTEQVHLLEDAMESAKDNASKVSRAGLQAVEDARKDFMRRIQELEREVLEARSHLKEKSCQVEEMAVELRTASVYIEDRERHMQQLQSTSADMQFARQQLFDQAMDGYDTLNAISNYLRTLQGDCERNEASIETLYRQLESVKGAMHSLDSLDGAAFAAYEEALRSGGAQLAREQEHTSYLQKEVASHKATTERLTGQLSQYQKEVTQLTELFTDLQDAVEESEGKLQKGQSELKTKTDEYDLLLQKFQLEEQACLMLREEAGSLKKYIRKLEAERDHLDVQLGNERSMATSQASLLEQRLSDAQKDLRRGSDVIEHERIRYEEELQELRSQLDEHTSTLASALDRLTHTSSKRTSAAPGSRNPSQSRNPSSYPRENHHYPLDPYSTDIPPYHNPHQHLPHHDHYQHAQHQYHDRTHPHATSSPSTASHDVRQPSLPHQEPSETPQSAGTNRPMNPLMAAVHASSMNSSRRGSRGDLFEAVLSHGGGGDELVPQSTTSSMPLNTLLGPSTRGATNAKREDSSIHGGLISTNNTSYNGSSHRQFLPTNRPHPSHHEDASSPVPSAQNGSPGSNISYTPQRGRSSSGAATNMVGM